MSINASLSKVERALSEIKASLTGDGYVVKAASSVALFLGAAAFATLLWLMIHIWWRPWSLTERIAAIATCAALLQCVALVWTIVVQVGTARRQLRAYMLPENTSLCDGMMLNPQQPQHANEPGVIIKFLNSGQTPAYSCVSWARIEVTAPQNAHTLVAPKLQLVSPATIGAGQVLTKPIWYGRSLTRQELTAIATGATRIFVYGRLEYRDAFGVSRWSNFKLHYTGPFPPPPGIVFSFNESGNSSN